MSVEAAKSLEMAYIWNRMVQLGMVVSGGMWLPNDKYAELWRRARDRQAAVARVAVRLTGYCDAPFPNYADIPATCEEIVELLTEYAI